MGSNSINKNIANALKVIYATYENVRKLIDHLYILASENSDYVSCTDKFLRWNKDKNIYSWADHSFILIFQSEKDVELDSGWRDGPLYVVDISLCDNDEASVYVARYDYSDVNMLPDRISSSNHHLLHNPLSHVDPEDDFIKYTYDGASYDGKVIDIAIADKTYWGLRRIVGYLFPLTEITSENAYEKVFGEFDKLSEK